MSEPKRRLLVIDTSYTYSMIVERDLYNSVTCRDLDGFFDHVWSVHPFASLLISEETKEKYGDPEIHLINDSHTFIDGKVGRYKSLRWFPTVNFFISQLFLIFKLVHLIRRNKISIIRVGGPLYVGVVGFLLAKLTKIRFLVRVGANYDKIYEVTQRPIEQRLFRFRSLEKIVEKFIFSHADMVAGANQNNLNFALQNGATNERSTIFRYGNLLDGIHFIDPNERNHFNDKTIAKIFSEPSRVITYVGRLQVEKHPEDVLEVFARIASKYVDVKLVMIGDGDLFTQLQDTVMENNLNERVFLVGNRSQEWLSTVLSKSSIVLSPHTGRALIEAALALNGIVAYDVDWQGEIIRDGQNGYLVNYRDVDSMFNCTVELLDNQDTLQEFAVRLRKNAIEMMSPCKLNAHEKNVYRSLINKSIAS